MKAIQYYIISTALLVQGILLLQAQNTEGREFWVTYGYSEMLLPYQPTSFTIHIANGNQTTSGYIYFTELGIYENFIINPFDIFIYDLEHYQKEAVYNTTAGVSNKSLYIYSEHPVSVCTGILRAQNGDVTNVLPLSALNTEYYQISYRPYGTSSFSDAYAVVATQNNTQLYHNNILEANLQAGEVYYKTSFNEMTGVRITSNHPVAFFTANQNVSIPHVELIANFEEEVGIENFELSTIKIYPNPTTGQLIIDSEKMRIENVEILDVFGKNVQMSPETVINISHLPAGVYFVKIQTEAGEVVKKVVKE